MFAQPCLPVERLACPLPPSGQRSASLDGCEPFDCVLSDKGTRGEFVWAFVSVSWDGCHSRWGPEWGPFFDRKQVFLVISVDGGSFALAGGGFWLGVRGLRPQTQSALQMTKKENLQVADWVCKVCKCVCAHGFPSPSQPMKVSTLWMAIKTQPVSQAGAI